MASSGLSLERFMQGKSHRRDLSVQKRKRVDKQVQLRKYRQVKEKHTNANAPSGNSFYDKFFSSLTKEEDGTLESKSKPSTAFNKDTVSTNVSSTKNIVDPTKEIGDHPSNKTSDHPSNKTSDPKRSKTVKSSSARPDRYFRSKQKANVRRMEKESKSTEIAKQLAKKEKVIAKRKAQHVQFSKRTARGQPLLEHRVKSVVSRLNKADL